MDVLHSSFELPLESSMLTTIPHSAPFNITNSPSNGQRGRVFFQLYPVMIAGGREMIFGFCNLERIGASFPTSINTTFCLGAFSNI